MAGEENKLEKACGTTQEHLLGLDEAEVVRLWQQCPGLQQLKEVLQRQRGPTGGGLRQEAELRWQEELYQLLVKTTEQLIRNNPQNIQPQNNIIMLREWNSINIKISASKTLP